MRLRRAWWWRRRRRWRRRRCRRRQPTASAACHRFLRARLLHLGRLVMRRTTTYVAPWRWRRRGDAGEAVMAVRALAKRAVRRGAGRAAKRRARSVREVARQARLARGVLLRSHRRVGLAVGAQHGRAVRALPALAVATVVGRLVLLAECSAALHLSVAAQARRALFARGHRLAATRGCLWLTRLLAAAPCCVRLARLLTATGLVVFCVGRRAAEGARVALAPRTCSTGSCARSVACGERGPWRYQVACEAHSGSWPALPCKRQRRS